MMHQQQVRLQRRVLRESIYNSSTASRTIVWLRRFAHFHLLLTCGSLFFSVVLLFIGTYIYLDAMHMPDDLMIIQTEPLLGSSLYENLVRFYGINQTDFGFLIPSCRFSSNYQMGMVMMWVALISILLEVALLVAILLNHFKLSLLLTLIMLTGLIHRLCHYSSFNFSSITFSGAFFASPSIASLLYQSAFLLCSVAYVIGLKTKQYTANRILKQTDNRIRLQSFVSNFDDRIAPSKRPKNSGIEMLQL